MAASPSDASVTRLPGWIDYALLPVINLIAALLVSCVLIIIIGENPIQALNAMVTGAFYYPGAFGYTLFYATSFIFTGLAVAIAFHAGLFNIGGEGQAYMGGLGASLVCLAAVGSGLPWPLVALLAIMAAALFGGVWGLIPGALAAYRGSHTVITTIMFNFIAAALMTYIVVNMLRPAGNQNPASEFFDTNAQLPTFRGIGEALGFNIGYSPLNISFPFALLCCVLFWVFVWKTRWGYELRTVGFNERAAVYAGISPRFVVVMAMTLSGALAGLMSLNALMGDSHQLILNFVGGFGFIGIAVALMGRNHPVGIVLASILFGALYHGGTELSFEIPTLSRDLVVVVQGLVILFTGALENMFKPTVHRLARQILSRTDRAAGSA